MTTGTKAAVVSPKSDVIAAQRKMVDTGLIPLCAGCDCELPDARSCYCQSCEDALYAEDEPEPCTLCGRSECDANCPA